MDEYPKVSGETSEEKKDEDPSILILEPELVRLEIGKENVVVPVQPK